MNSSVDFDKNSHFLGYYYGVGEVMSQNIYPQPGMFFVNGETNSVWVWDSLTRIWVDTNRVDGGLKGMLTDKAGNSPSDYIPSPQVGIKESYFYVAKTNSPKEIVFTYFKNGNTSVCVNIAKTSVIILFWNGDYWEANIIPMNIDLDEFAGRDEVESMNEDIRDIQNSLYSPERDFSHNFSSKYEIVKLPFKIPKGAVIYMSGDITSVLARKNEDDEDYQIIKSGDVANRDIKYIKNTEETGSLNLKTQESGIELLLFKIGKNLEILDGIVSSIESELKGGDFEYLLEDSIFPARYDSSELMSGYFRGYKVDLTPYVGKYKEVYFRGAEFGYPSTGTEVARGVILDSAGNIESKTSYVADLSNGWQTLPLTENSKTLWASYCVANEGGEVWTPEYVLFRNDGDKGILDKLQGEVEVVLPKDIYIPQGKVSQLFFRGFVKAVSPYKYDIKVMCDKGKTFPRYYEFDGNVPVGDYPITVQVRNDNLNVLGEAKSVVHVVDVNNTPYANVLCVGASATATGCWAAELNRLMPTLNFVGAKRGTDEDVRLEATGGWSWSNFISTDAPFANANFKSYADKYCGGSIDLLITHIGVNNSLWELSNEESAISNARTFIKGYFRDFPNGKMIISAIPMPDGGTNVYENSDSENNINRYGTLTSFLRYNKALSDLVEELKGEYDITYAPTNLFFDTDYGYPKEHRSVNTRMSGYKEMVGINGVHPIPEGSYMIADGILPVLSTIV